jgi:hypothetical protein
MASLDLTSFAPVLKRLYGPEKIETLAYTNNPFLALVPKDTGFEGSAKQIPLRYGTPQGRSAAFASALANQTASKYKDFLLTRVKDYAIASISNETILASASDKGAFMQALTSEMDGALISLSRSLATALYRSGSGSIGQVTTGGTGTSITLLNVNDVVNFETGMEIVFSTADGGGSVKSGSIAITGVNRDTGVLTVEAMSAIDGGTGTASNDFIFVQGDYGVKVSGLQAWIPNSAPGATAFFGVDRTADVTRLGGIRVDGSGLSIEEALVNGITRVAREGGKTSHVFMNYNKYQELQNSLGSKVQIINEMVKPNIGFSGMQIQSPSGVVKVIPDANCPSDRAFLLQLDTWKLHSLKAAPHLIESDGLKTLRASDADDLQFRMAYYANLACYAPGWNANLLLG